MLKAVVGGGDFQELGAGRGMSFVTVPPGCDMFFRANRSLLKVKRGSMYGALS